MSTRDALDRRLAELQQVEDQRRTEKSAAFKEDFQADDVSLDRVGDVEVVVLDRQFVLVEVTPRDHRPAASHCSGPGQGEYKPGTRMLLGVKPNGSGSPRLTDMRVKNIDEMAAVALLKGVEFDELTGPVEVILAAEKDAFWYNNVNC